MNAEFEDDEHEMQVSLEGSCPHGAEMIFLHLYGQGLSVCLTMEDARVLHRLMGQAIEQADRSQESQN